jgi:uncharacterized protein YjdB
VSNASPTQGQVTAGSTTAGFFNPSTPGTVVISATLSGVSNNAVLTIKPVTTTALVVTPAAATIGWGDKVQFTATATFSDGTQQDVTNNATWTAAQPITTNSGLVTGQTLGSGSVTAMFGSSANAAVTVNLNNLVSASITPAPLTMANFTQLQLGVLGTFADGSTRDLSILATNWLSSNYLVGNFLSLTPGVVTAAGAGTTIITTTIGSTTLAATLNVTSAQLKTVSIFPANRSLAVGTKMYFTAIAAFDDGTTQDVTQVVKWYPADASLVYLTIATGVATGQATGSTLISATSPSNLGSVPGYTPLSVTGATLNSVAVSPAAPFTLPGNIMNLVAIGTFSDGTTQDISGTSTWSSPTLSVATVQGNTATAQGVGQSLISAKQSKIKGVSAFSVALPGQVTLSVMPTQLQMAAGTSGPLSATGTLGGATQDLTTGVNWSSSDATVATVGWQTGIVNALSPGQAAITATMGSVTGQVALTVSSARLSAILVSPANSTVTLGTSEQLAASGTFSDNSTQTLAGAVWTSSDPTIAVVDSTGLVNSIGVGTVTITATVNGTSGSTSLTIQ